MGRKIITNNENKWELCSTVNDKVIATFTTERDLKKAIAIELIYEGKLKAIEELMSYPYGWVVNDEMTLINQNKKGVRSYYDWYKSITNLNDEETNEAIDSKLQELLS